ncbi:MAG: methyltransferase [Hyphomicrobiaceae bacterium]
MSDRLETTDDAFLGGRLLLRQPVNGHRAGLDAVLLAAAVQHEGAARALDAGAGAGIVTLALATRLPAVEVVGVEIESALVALAEENARRNELAGRVQFVHGDVTAPAAELAAHGVVPAGFDIVVSNPPFLEDGTSKASPLPLQARASSMPAASLERWARFYAAMARPDGRLYLVHRADRLRDLIDALDGRFGALEVLPLHPKAGASASRIILRGRKGSRAPMQLRPGLVLHGAEGAFEPAIERVLRGPEALSW